LSFRSIVDHWWRPVIVAWCSRFRRLGKGAEIQKVRSSEYHVRAVQSEITQASEQLIVRLISRIFRFSSSDTESASKTGDSSPPEELEYEWAGFVLVPVAAEDGETGDDSLAFVGLRQDDSLAEEP
jgi:hypothetical protein